VLKGNFDVVVWGNFAIATAVLGDPSGEIIFVATQKPFSSNVLSGEASTTLLASRLAATSGFSNFILEGMPFWLF
jgi:hypothetical protein